MDQRGVFGLLETVVVVVVDLLESLDVIVSKKV